MKALKSRIISFVVAGSIALSPLSAIANQYEDSVNEAINASMEAAKADAQALVEEDYGKLSDAIADQLTAYIKSEGLLDVYRALVRDLELELAQLSTTEIEDLNRSEAAIRSFMERYEKSVRKKFLASWIPAQQTREFEVARNTIINLSSDFKKLCGKGHGIKGRSYINPAFTPPPYVSSFDVKVAPNWISPLTNSFPVNINYGFTSVTGGSDKANRDRARALAITSTASNLANGMLISAKFASMAGISVSTTGAAAAVSQAMIAAAPYLAAVAILTMIVVDVMAKKEATKLNNQLQDALHKQGMNTADGETLNEFYRSNCKAYSNAIDKVVSVFRQLESARTRADVLKNAEDLQPAMRKWEAESLTMPPLNCKIALNRLHTNFGCRQLAPDTIIADLKIDPEKPGERCAIDAAKANIFALDGTCRIPFEEGERKSVIEAAEAKVKDYDNAYPADLVVSFLTANVATVFARQEQTANEWRSASFAKLDEVESRAFTQLLRVINKMKAVQKQSGGVLKLNAEIEVQKQFVAYRKAALALGEKTIRVIVKKASPNGLVAEWLKLKTSYASFALKYRHIKEVRDLQSAINAVAEEAGAIK